MSTLLTFILSLVTGFMISIPIGPVALSIVRKTLNKGKKSGLQAALGSVTIDIFYSCLVAFGITFVMSFLERYSEIFQMIAAVFIAAMGIKTLQNRKEDKPIQSTNNRDFLETFFLALSNPLTLLAIAGFLAAFGIDPQSYHLRHAFAVIIGLATGEFLWWLFLINLFALIGQRASEKALQKINQIAGYSLLILSLIILTRIFYSRCLWG